MNDKLHIADTDLALYAMGALSAEEMELSARAHLEACDQMQGRAAPESRWPSPPTRKPLPSQPRLTEQKLVSWPGLQPLRSLRLKPSLKLKPLPLR
jgi:hypothetical protein